MAGRGRVFTIFDVMEDKGVFRANSANPNAVDREGRPLYAGPVQFPMMVYHPKGEEEILVPGVAEMTPFGPKMVGEQRGIIYRIVGNAQELREATAEGWHDHPAKAIAAANALRVERGEAPLPVPPISAASTISGLEKQLAEAQAALALAQENAKIGQKEVEDKIVSDIKAGPKAKGLV